MSTSCKRGGFMAPVLGSDDNSNSMSMDGGKKKRAAKKPAAKKPAAKKPMAKKPMAKKPAAKKVKKTTK